MNNNEKENQTPNDETVEEKKEDETKESRGITRNPFLWMIAIAIVVWWKWDEIQGYIS